MSRTLRAGAFAAIVGVACATTSATDYARSVSVGHVGCPEQEMVVVGEPQTNPVDMRATWQIACRGRTYFCSKGNPGGQVDSSHEGVKCAEAAAAPAPALAPTPPTPPTPPAAQ